MLTFVMLAAAQDQPAKQRRDSDQLSISNAQQQARHTATSPTPPPITAQEQYASALAMSRDFDTLLAARMNWDSHVW